MGLNRLDLLPAGMSGLNGLRFADWEIAIFDSGEIDSKNLAKLQNMEYATGENLRRIGYNLGFSFVTDDDELYRKNLLAFIIIKTCNGSIGSIYDSLEIYGYDTSKIDIYDSFSFSKGILLDGTRSLDGRWTLNNDYDQPLFSSYLDFYRSDNVAFVGADTLSEFCRPPGRPILPREIFALNLDDSLPDLNDLILDGSWILDGSKRLDPHALADTCQLWEGGNLVAESKISSPSVRLENAIDFTFNTFAQFDEIRVLANSKLIAKKIYNLTNFWFKIQIVQWLFSATKGEQR